MPFNAIEGFGKIEFKQESFMVPSLEVERVDHLLGNNDIRSNVASLNESSLSWMNDVGEVMFEAVSQGSGNDFVADIAEANGTKISRGDRNIFLRNKGNESTVDGIWEMSRMVE
jgi:hypothetical protein